MRPAHSSCSETIEISHSIEHAFTVVDLRSYRGKPAIIKLSQMYPSAIHTKNIFGQLPIHLAMQTFAAVILLSTMLLP